MFLPSENATNKRAMSLYTCEWFETLNPGNVIIIVLYHCKKYVEMDVWSHKVGQNEKRRTKYV